MKGAIVSNDMEERPKGEIVLYQEDGRNVPVQVRMPMIHFGCHSGISRSYLEYRYPSFPNIFRIFTKRENSIRKQLFPKWK
jgi:hypothetical protein